MDNKWVDIRMGGWVDNRLVYRELGERVERSMYKREDERRNGRMNRRMNERKCNWLSYIEIYFFITIYTLV